MRMLHAQKGASATVEEFAAGILRVIDTEMEKAIRVVSVERGHDPRGSVLQLSQCGTRRRPLYLKASFAEADDQMFDQIRLPPDR
jgi:hypothetical protein